jgi:membrane-associated protein
MAGIFAAHGHPDLFTLNVTLSLAAIAGDSVGYGIGYRTGPKIFNRQNSLLFNRKHMISAKEFYERHGPFTIVVARFMPIIRTFAPVVAGVGAMQYRKFITYNVFGGIFWVLTTTLAGYFLGTMIPDIQKQIHVVIAIVIFVSLLPAIIKFASERQVCEIDY